MAARDVSKVGAKVLDTAKAVIGRRKVRYEIDSAWLKGQLVDKFGDRGWCKAPAKLMGVDISTMSRLVHDGREWRPHQIMMYQNIVRRPLEEIMAYIVPGIPATMPESRVKVVGHLGADGVVHAGPSIGRRAVPNLSGLGDTHAVTVIEPGSSMDGWVLYYGAPAARIDDVVGRLCVVRHQFHEDVAVGVVRRGSSTGLYGLAGFAGINRAYEESRLIDAAPVSLVHMG